MKISIHKHPLNQYYEVGIFAPETDTDSAQYVKINDEAHRNLGEVEAKARAAAIRAVTGWPVCLEYELD